MLGRFRNALHRRMKHLFRHDRDKQSSASNQKPPVSNNVRGTNGTLKSSIKQDRQVLMSPPAGMHNQVQTTPVTTNNLHPTGQDPCAIDNNLQIATGHPAVHPLTARPVPRSPQLEDPRESLLFDLPPPQHNKDGRLSNSSEGDVAITRQLSQPTIEDSAPGKAISSNEAYGLQEQPLEAPLSRNTQQLGRIEHHDFDKDEESHYQLSNQKGHVAYEEIAARHGGQERAESEVVGLGHQFDRVQNHPDIYFDHKAHNRPAVTQEDIKPHIHTIYEPHRTRSVHFHEHRTVIQPIIDPNPKILPEEHYAQDDTTGEIFKIPNELGRKLDETFGRDDVGRLAVDDGDIAGAIGRLDLNGRDLKAH